jgi:TonB-dependent starch-binding outer membrane protein SusC
MRKKILYSLSAIVCLMLYLPLFAQQKTVTGVVRENNAPSIGATVLVKGTNQGTKTDVNGEFRIEVPANATTLVISSVGFETKEVDISSSNRVTVELVAAANSLNEVVVTGYSSQRKKDITGAVAVVNVKDLKSVPTNDAQSQLQGRASGVTVTQNSIPGGSANVRIRGLGSFNNNNPLYVVDGVQTGSISALNPNDIESMQVLKDAATASVYGVRASNGVIIVTTKKGRKSGVNVTYDMYYGVQVPGEGLDLLNAQEQAELLFLARRNSGLSTSGSVFGNGTSPVLPDYIYYSGAANNGVPINAGNPGVDPAKYALDYGRLGDPGYNPYIIVPTAKNGTNWYDEITRNAPMQNHNVTLSGANEASRYMLSLNYFDQDAITKYQFFKRYTARLNSEFNVMRNVRIGENLQVLTDESNVGNNVQNEASIIAQTSRITSIVPVYTIKDGDFAGTAGGSGFGTWGNGKNPVAMLYRNRDNRTKNLNVFGNVYGEVDFLKNFTFRTSFGGAINDQTTYSYPYIEYEHTENSAVTTYNENYFNNWQWLWTNQLSYRHNFGKHSISALAGTEAQKGGGRQIIGSASGYYSYDYRPFINLSNGTVQNLGGSVSYTPGTTVSYFAKADYAFNGRYLVSATFRRDGSSKFLGDNKWGNFPAFSLGWIMTEETFAQNWKFLNFFKVRGSWGKLGNEAAVSSSNAFTTFGSNRQSSWYDINGTQNSPQEGFFLSFVGNPLGRWETGISTNIGFDATILNNSTEIVFDWYQKKTEDLLYNPSGQAIGGAVAANNPSFKNVGSMKNSGIDLMINNRSNLTKDLRLITTLTFTTYKNEITEINGEQEFFDFNSPVNEANRIGSNATRNFVGEALNTYYGYKVIGLFQTAAEATAWNQAGAAPGRFKYADVNGDKKIDADDRTIIGDPNADFSYGLNLALEYKGFDLGMFFYGVAGKDAFNFTRWYTDFSSGFPGGRSKRSLYESWLPDGSRPNATTPIQETTIAASGFSTSGVVNSYYVENASYFRMRNLQIGYTLPTAWSNKAKLSKVRFYVQGTNLFTITDYSNINPEIISADDRSSSVDIGAYPVVKQFFFGANIGF